MSGLIPIPTTRITSLYSRQRLTQQLQADQLDLFRLQDQISTGQRIILPSDDAPSALQAISLQRLLERKTQLSESVSTGLEFLAATDSTLGTVSELLFDVKADTLEVVGTVTTEEQRNSAIATINSALDQLLTTANTQYRDRYLFSGTQTSQTPYEIVDEGIVFHGDTGTVQSYSDINVLFETSISGQYVFGGLSESVEGTADLNPQLGEGTLLSDLRGGEGIEANSVFTISDGTEISTIDISGAVTVGDVKRLIEENIPGGRDLNVTITGQGIDLQFDPASAANAGANLIVEEVGTGNTARELGILTESGVGTALSVGEDIDPVLRATTRLDDLLGTKARAVLENSGANNDIELRAATNGTDLNGVTIQFADDPGVSPGSETVVYDDVGNTLTINIDAGNSTANDVINAINNEGTFTAELDPNDTLELVDAGTGAVELAATAITSGGSGESLDLASGIQIVNGGESHTITFEDAETVNDLLNILNGSDAHVFAEVNEAGDGIDIRSKISGTDFQIGENGGQTATQLGVRTLHADTELSELNFSRSEPEYNPFELPTTEGTDLTIDTIDGQSFSIDLSDAESISDVVDAINAVTGAAVTATEVVTGNVSVVRLDDNSAAGTDLFTITQADGSLAGQYLGLVPNGETEVDTTGSFLQGDDARYSDLTITAKDGLTYSVDLSGADTIGEVIDQLNAALAGSNVTAQLASEGNGIELVDTTGGVGDLEIRAVQGSNVAEYLGLIAEGEDATTTVGTTLTGEDRNYFETDSVFTSLIRLRDALEANDTDEISRAAAKLDEDIDRLTFARADVGAQQQALDISKLSLQEEDIQLQSALSEEIDVDLVQAISDLTARQISLEASLAATANVLQLSLLNFI